MTDSEKELEREIVELRLFAETMIDVMAGLENWQARQ